MKNFDEKEKGKKKGGKKEKERRRVVGEGSREEGPFKNKVVKEERGRRERDLRGEREEIFIGEGGGTQNLRSQMEEGGDPHRG